MHTEGDARRWADDLSGGARGAGADTGPRVRALLLGDTHLGFDDPSHPRVTKRRRGPDFYAAFRAALAPALRGHVDLVVHGGDLFHRSRPPTSVIDRAFAPLLEVADAGIPVFVVPGNHERSRLPLPLLAHHPLLRIFHQPQTMRTRVGDLIVELVGIPFRRHVGAHRFGELVARAEAKQTSASTSVAQSGHAPADVRLLCIHQSVAGATVGVQNYMFRAGPDVISPEAIPTGYAAVLSGHIHRAQILRRAPGVDGAALAAPVVYAGSTERTSIAERTEAKGYRLLEFAPDPAIAGGRMVRWDFVELPTRPMVLVEVDLSGLDVDAASRRIQSTLARQAPNAVVRLRAGGARVGLASRVLTAAWVRNLAPPTMTVDLDWRAAMSSAAAGSDSAGHERISPAGRGARGA